MCSSKETRPFFKHNTFVISDCDHDIIMCDDVRGDIIYYENQLSEDSEEDIDEF